MPEELVWVNDLSVLDPDGVLLHDLTILQDFAVDDFSHFWFIPGHWSSWLRRGWGRGVVVGLKGDGILHYGFLGEVSEEPVYRSLFGGTTWMRRRVR